MKTVIVTGGTRGLGLAIIGQLAAAGHKAVAIGRNCSGELAALIERNPDSVAFEAFDFNETARIHDLATDLVKLYGRPFGLVNNAAVGYDGILATQHDSEIRCLLRINVEAPVLLTKYLVRPMLINGEGRIVNISSIIANTGFSGLSVYAASKAALVGFTRSLARELGKSKITVNAVAPGYLATDMTAGLTGDRLESVKRRTALGRLPEIGDVAGGVLYFLGPYAASITGTVLTVDAGSTA